MWSAVDLLMQIWCRWGASSGIGRATAILFAEKGYQLSLNGRNEEALAETVKECIAKGVPKESVCHHRQFQITIHILQPPSKISIVWNCTTKLIKLKEISWYNQRIISFRSQTPKRFDVCSNFMRIETDSESQLEYRSGEWRSMWSRLWWHAVI